MASQQVPTETWLCACVCARHISGAPGSRGGPSGHWSQLFKPPWLTTGTSGSGGYKDLLAWGQGKDSVPQNGSD